MILVGERQKGKTAQALNKLIEVLEKGERVVIISYGLNHARKIRETILTKTDKATIDNIDISNSLSDITNKNYKYVFIDNLEFLFSDNVYGTISLTEDNEVFKLVD